MTATFPSTGDFPSRPDALAREELDAVYLELRRSYKGLMVSRGQYRSKAERNRAAMQQLEAKLREIANREAAVRHEAYEMLEIVTKVVGELEDAGDDLVNEFGLYQKGRRTLRWVPFIGQFRPLTSLTPGGRNSVRSQCRPHGEFCLPRSCVALHGSTSRGSGPG